MEASEVLRIREKLGLTQQELADRLGASYASVNRWERGHATISAAYASKLQALVSKPVFNAFLSMPYGTDAASQTYWRALRTAITDIVQSMDEARVMVSWAGESPLALTLKDSVQQRISEADLMIAVLATNNPNVFWEIGYAEAQGKPVVYLMDEDSASVAEAPVMVSSALRVTYGMGRHAEPENGQLTEQMASRLKGSIALAARAARPAPRPAAFGVYSDRGACDLPKLIAGARDRILLTTTNLYYFADLDNFVASGTYAFDPPVQRGVNVSVLVMDPESLMVKYRAEQLGLDYDVRRYREELREAVGRFYERYKDKHNVRVRIYDDLPLQITLIVDDQAVTSVMSRGSRSRSSLHFAVPLDSPGAAEAFEKHFYEVISARSRDISTFKWAFGK